MSVRLKSIVIEDFRSIRGAQRLSLDAPVVLVHGPNGTGKTSLLSAIEFGLTGSVASFSRADPGYMAYLPHKKSATGKCRVSIEVDGLAEHTADVVGDGKGVIGRGLLAREQTRFFTERCYLPQATLGRLLEIYEHQDNRLSDTPLTRFVKELLGLEALDALINGLYVAGDVRRLREKAPKFWSARSGAADLTKQVEVSAASVGTLRHAVTTLEAHLRDEIATFSQPIVGFDPKAIALHIAQEQGRIDSNLFDLARRRRDLASADAQLNAATLADGGKLQAAEAALIHARSLLRTWQAGTGGDLEKLLAAIRERFPSIAGSSSDPQSAHTGAARVVATEMLRLKGIADQTAADEKALVDIEESLRSATSRLSTIDSELDQGKGANQELAESLTAISSHIDGDVCPVCGRDFGEIADTPLAAHISAEVQRLITAAGRVNALVRDRSTTAAAVMQAQRRQMELTARRLSDVQRSRNRKELALVSGWNAALADLAAAAAEGLRSQEAMSEAELQLSLMTTQQAGVRGLREELAQHAKTLGLAALVDTASLKDVLSSLMTEVQRQEDVLQSTAARHRASLEQLEELTRSRAALEKAVGELSEITARQTTQIRHRKESESRIEAAKDLAHRAQELRTEKVRQVFNDELNAVWSELFIRLAPDEDFVPEFALPPPGNGPVEAVLETRYRPGGRGGKPRAMLSAGNLNTAAVTLFLALNLSVKPVLPWLIIDDPVQSMDDVHIAQFAALLRTLKQKDRQVILAVHDRQLFDYLALELSPTSDGDRLITIELGRSADGFTTAPWLLTVFSPDRAIAA